MPRVELVLQVFVASPSDVMPEREVLESIILELNQIWSKKLNLRLELNRWETNTYSSFGKDPQDVINRQIGNEFDIFIGILWGRVGTPTPRAVSGTLEEFERAYERYKNDPNSIEIMFYFKDHPIPPSKIKPEQLQKLQEFKSNLGEKGGLYFPFEDIAKFESLLRNHLSKVAHNWTKRIPTEFPYLILNKSNNEKDTCNTEHTIFEDREEWGLLDHYDNIQANAENFESSLEELSEATYNIQQQILRQSERLNIVNNSSHHNNQKQKESQKIIKFAANNMKSYSLALDEHTPAFSYNRNVLFESINIALSVMREFCSSGDEENILTILDKQLKELKEVVDESKDSLFLFRETVENLPKISKLLNKAKRKVAKSLEETENELVSTVKIITELQDAILKQKQNI